MTRYNTVDEVVACYTMQVVACYIMPGVVLNLSDFTPAVKKELDYSGQIGNFLSTFVTKTPA